MADEAKFTQADLEKAVQAATGKVQESIDRLEAKNEELVGELRTTKTELRKSKDIDPADLAKLEEENEKLRGDLSKASKDAKDAVSRAEKAEKQIETESGFTAKLLTENALNDALTEAGVKEPTMLKYTKAMFAGLATVATEGDQRIVKIGDKALADHIKEWAGGDEAKHFISAADNSGGGAGGGKGGGGSGKTMDRKAFDVLPHSERAAFAKEGGKVVDQAA